MNSIQFVESVKTHFLKVFPNGYFEAKKLFGGDVSIVMGLTRDQVDCPHNIRDNDRMRMIFAVHGMQFNSTEDVSNKVQLEPYYSAISTIPRLQYNAMGHDKIKTRKTTNTPDKLLATLTKYINNAGEMVLDLKAKNEIYRQEEMKEKYFEINL